MTVQPNAFPTALSELDRLVETRKIPNALLFEGLPGSGRKQAAYWFAKAVNCEEEGVHPCSRCRSCRKIDTDHHPDMIVLAPAGSQKPIPISQIREMIARTGSRPHEAAYRMVLITDACRMNLQAQNALLKELEEPPETTFFILMARERSGLLSTIISRCRSLRFPPLSGSALAAHLSNHYSVDTQWAGIAAATAGTDMNLVKNLINAPEISGSESHEKQKTDTSSNLDWQTIRPWLIRQICCLVSKPGFRHIQTALGLSEFLSQDSERVAPGLAVMKTVFRDLCVIGHAPDKLLNIDFIDAFRALGPSIHNGTPLFWMDELYETEKRLTSNSSIRMTFDRFFLKLINFQGSPS